jgi:ABC-type antimicrobial peptide transport system permease subunit
MTLLAGRDFSLSDNEQGQKVVIVNQTMARRYFPDDHAVGRRVLVADLAGFFGTLTLALLSIGVYGTLAYAVGQRTKEIGVRLALGARRAIVWTGFRQISTVVVVGSAIGVASVFAAGRLVRPLLFGLKPTDPWTIAGALVLLVGVSLLAGSLPARAAWRLDPATVLRE